MLPIAVTIKLNDRVASLLVINSTLSLVTMLASVPTIEYAWRLQSGLLYVKG